MGRTQSRNRQTKAATQPTSANTTAAVNAPPPPPAFRACSISVIELLSIVGRECYVLKRTRTSPFLFFICVLFFGAPTVQLLNERRWRMIRSLAWPCTHSPIGKRRLHLRFRHDGILNEVVAGRSRVACEGPVQCYRRSCSDGQLCTISRPRVARALTATAHCPVYR